MKSLNNASGTRDYQLRRHFGQEWGNGMAKSKSAGRPFKGSSDTIEGQLGMAIRRARLRAGLEVAETAGDAGIEMSTWYAYERGQHCPSVVRLIEICDELGWKASNILRAAGH